MGLPALRNYEVTDFSFHFAGALSFHFLWCWGWGTLYDTHAEISGNVAPGDPPPDPCLSLIQACLWKFEVGPLPDSVAAAPFATADTWNRRLCAAARRGTRGVHAVGGGHGHCHSPTPCGTGPPPTQGSLGRRPPPAPAAGETPAPHGVLFGFPWRLFPAGLFVFLQITDAGKTA